MKSQGCSIYAIEGIPSAGKTTLLIRLRERNEHQNSLERKIVFVDEPVSLWETIVDENGVNLIENYYKDTRKFAFPFQMAACISRYAALRKAVEENPGDIIVMERSLLADRYVFATMLRDSGDIEQIHFRIYLEMYEIFASDYPVNGVIFMNTTPEECYERMRIRARPGEESVSLEYLRACGRYQTEMLDKNSVNCVCENQLVLDINTTEKVEKVFEFIK
jgi:deoxyadenosine/deoxycytidine kinase